MHQSADEKKQEYQKTVGYWQRGEFGGRLHGFNVKHEFVIHGGRGAKKVATSQ